ncbi:hypothetical protein [Microvirga flavescens]|uniref:hypothetical protein n=1 Tax=Microvirga flavescens TaxID=2249811 RepID=UPI000DDAA354|nr:hypothetical protein [Microvirga flavescens]
MKHVDREQDTYAQMSDAVQDLDRHLHDACCASHILETVLRGHFDGATRDPDGYFRFALKQDDLEALIHCVYHAGDVVRDARKDLEKAHEKGLLNAVKDVQGTAPEQEG